MSLTVENLALGFGERTILRQVNFSIPPGSFVGLIGANGSGKSTLMRALGSLQTPQQGRIVMGEIDVQSERERALKQLGFALEPSLLPPRLTGHQAIALTRKILNDDAPDDALGALRAATRLTPLLDELIARYSLGTQQKLAIALALIGRPKLLLLDESLNGLDPRSALLVKRFLKDYVVRENAIVILATHAIGAVERFCDEILMVTEKGGIRHLDRSQLADLRRSAPSIEEALIGEILSD